MLNSNIDKVLADLGHTDQLTIGDLGLPVPSGIAKIDLTLRVGQPSFIDVLETVAQEMVVEKIILAEEIKEQNPRQLAAVKEVFPQLKIEFINHEAFKRQTQTSKAVIRTGEATPFSNIILQSGVLF